MDMSQAQDLNLSGPLPLRDVRVIEFVHMVMGPSCGLILADLGAEVIKVEPVKGDNTRRLVGAGAGFYVYFNRNKKSLAINLKSDSGREIIHRLTGTADVMTENFRPGAMEGLGFGYKAMSEINPRLIYASLKGFLEGPYAQRTALDEVVQMMGGLAYMTGPPGRPLRAGSSVNDIMGGMFAVIGILAALHERQHSGRGQEIKSALFENNVFLVAQHMLQKAITGQAPAPMPERLSAWGIYDVFKTRDDQQLFIGVVTDSQWQVFCERFELHALFADPQLATNNLRVTARATLIPEIAKVFAHYDKLVLMEIFESIGLPFAPITRPEDLFDDPHLNSSGGLLDIRLPDGRVCKAPALPLEQNGKRPGVRLHAPQIGEHNQSLLQELGYDDIAIAKLRAEQVIAEVDETDSDSTGNR